MSQRKIISIAAITLVFLTLFLLFDYSQKNKLSNQPISPNILYLTQPVTSFSGIVEKVEGNAISVSSQYSVPQTAPITITVLPGQMPVAPTPKMITITYNVVISGKTQITQPITSVPYLFSTTNLVSAPQLTIKDIKVGQRITLNSLVDLRTLEGALLEASVINLPQKQNILNGNILNIKENKLVLRAFAPLTGTGLLNVIQPTPHEKEFTITITQNTEISRISYSSTVVPGETLMPPKPEKLTLSDLKKDMQIIVYADSDVATQTQLTALRIEPMLAPVVPAALPPQMATSAASL